MRSNSAASGSPFFNLLKVINELINFILSIYFVAKNNYQVTVGAGMPCAVPVSLAVSPSLTQALFGFLLNEGSSAVNLIQIQVVNS